MFFSRSRPSQAKINAARAAEQAAIATAAKAEKAAEVSSRRLNLIATAQKPALKLPKIDDFKDVPDGQYQHFEALGIPTSFETTFAFMKTGIDSGVLLTASEALATHPQFEVQRRLQEGGFSSVSIREATGEIIKALHGASGEAETHASETEVEKMAWAIVEDAVAKRASDIHIETSGAFARIFYRIYGERVEQASISKDSATAVCNVLYGVHAEADSKGLAWDPKTIKDAVVPYRAQKGTPIQLRFSSGPKHGDNFAAVMRVLNMDSGAAKPLEEVGYSKAQVEAIEEMLLGGRGAVILVGPTNAGKSTSMQAFIERIYQFRGRHIKVQTVEDPVEYLIPDAHQMGVPAGRKDLMDERTGSVFATFLKAMLRQDPDVGMIGEIRDADSAENMKNLVLAGRKLLSTLHVYEVFAVFARLREIGVPESVLFMEKFITGVICQRLLPTLCPDCSIPVAEAYAAGDVRQKTYDRLMRVIDFEADNVRVRRKGGCECCNYTGIVGRSLCAEILAPDATLLAHLARGDLSGARQYWATQARNRGLDLGGHGATMMAHAIYKMRHGEIDPHDIESQIDPISSDSGWTQPVGSGRSAILPAASFPNSLK